MRKYDGSDIAAGQANAPELPVDRFFERLRGFFPLAQALFRRAVTGKRKNGSKDKSPKPQHVEDSFVTLGGIYIGPYAKISDRNRRLMDWLE